MKLASVLVQVFSFLNVAITASLAISLSRPGCQDKCGNVTIPYPFGIGAKCSANSSFTIICKNSTVNPPRPFLRSLKSEVVNISLYGVVIVNLPVSPVKCSDVLRKEFLPISLEGSPFTISAHYNSLVVMGCRNSVWLLDNETMVGECMAICDANSKNTSCNGNNCCQIAIPSRLRELKYEYQSFRTTNSSSCGYVFPCDKEWLQGEGYKRYKGFLSDAEFGFAPVVLEWEFDNTKRLPHRRSSSICKQHDNDNENDNYHKKDGHSRVTYDYVSAIRYCTCRSGFEGNPYIVEGCRDINECSDARLNNCGDPTSCINIYGGFDCTHPWYGGGYYGSYYGDYQSRDAQTIVGIVFIVAGIGPRVLVFLIMAWKLGKVIKARRKHTVYKRNGGLLLEQHLAAIERGIERAKLFSSKELAKATGNYSESRIVGRGGEGVVYKGMLEDGTVVAIKKSERVYKGDVEAFINEVVIVSQINHRNVVKLIGCGLESEVPRLVYEFIPNGTLFSHIHHSHQDFPLFWEIRVRIAKEVAGALAYLHSAASIPIYHRDIKSTNILLDEKYHAKISDFGTSRSVSIDQSHVTTRVVGTFGYLDPEYFQSNQFTEKSDVYSFGVVLVELLTGEKTISAARVEEGRGLAMHFLMSMEENQLFNIVDARVLREGKREDIEAMAEVARRCLHLNGRSRPTMKEVARDLEGIQVEKQEPDSARNQIDSSGCNSIESDDYSSTSEIIELPSSGES